MTIRSVALAVALFASSCVLAGTPVRTAITSDPDTGATVGTIQVDILGLMTYRQSDWCKNTWAPIRPVAIVGDAYIHGWAEAPIQMTVAHLGVMTICNTFGFQDWLKDTFRLGGSGGDDSTDNPDQQATSTTGDALALNVSGSGNTINVNTGDTSSEQTTAYFRYRADPMVRWMEHEEERMAARLEKGGSLLQLAGMPIQDVGPRYGLYLAKN